MNSSVSNEIQSITNGLAGRLIAEGILSNDQARDAEQDARSMGVSLIRYLIDTLDVDSGELAEMASAEFGVPVFDLNAMNREMLPEQQIDAELMVKHHAVPLFRRGHHLFVAVSDPLNLSALDEFKFAAGINTDAVLVEDEALSKLITDLAEQSGGFDKDMNSLGADEAYDLEIGDGSIEEDDDVRDAADETPIVRFVNKVLLDAIKQGASDIHFEPYEKDYRVRFRTDGILREIVKPPRNLAPRLAARLKVMSQMDISERRTPQDGRIQMKLSKKRAIDFRVNTLPTMYGEKIVLRILDPTSAQLGIDALGYEEGQKALYMEALQKPQGMILVTGPTGSGKTVSLYTGLGILNEPVRNISTAEDPVEINMAGINQVLVNPKVGLNFAEALRSFLRQDPDVIMVGEIRDLETAEISIKAAQTGHLVLSTVHTNSAAETVTRLLNMGVPAFNIAASVTLIIAQRLARRLCGHCAEPETSVPQEALLQLGFTVDQLGTAMIKRPLGCGHCQDGYKGRVGIYEVVKITKPIASAIMDGANSLELDRVAREAGFNNLRQSALRKCAEGLISLEEVSRVTTD
ncbi:MAG: type IV-A pilus assembly ATPase PilB [Halieaceae bacterium]|nr:type IV-A pilus assembly ATPase PilB [Halieaceae bacterium]MDG1932620.1 type IV-A pilus assembly ATPase PilB [Luminiphilus sp.]MDG2038456.1 type IV-A pilus assembly ATPase PilB [Luminiphilus sp.]|tara:strand:- start:869 stop:2599 length:1731 start_codon:yes stop_codon:yes gene_type:complete